MFTVRSCEQVGHTPKIKIFSNICWIWNLLCIEDIAKMLLTVKWVKLFFIRKKDYENKKLKEIPFATVYHPPLRQIREMFKEIFISCIKILNLTLPCRGPFHIETSPLICNSINWFLYDRDLSHERVQKIFIQAPLACFRSPSKLASHV